MCAVLQFFGFVLTPIHWCISCEFSCLFLGWQLNLTNIFRVYCQCYIKVFFIIRVILYPRPYNIFSWCKFMCLVQGSPFRNETLKSFCILSFINFTDLYLTSWVSKILEFFTEISSVWSFINLERILSWLSYVDCKVNPFTIFIHTRLIYVWSVIIDLSDCHGTEFCHEVRISHKEYSIISILIVVNPFFLFLWDFFPVFIKIRPLSFKLTWSPRISELNNFFFSILCVYFCCVEKSVSMTLNNSTSTFICVRTGIWRGYHPILQFWSLYQGFPILFWIILL